MHTYTYVRTNVHNMYLCIDLIVLSNALYYSVLTAHIRGAYYICIVTYVCNNLATDVNFYDHHDCVSVVSTYVCVCLYTYLMNALCKTCVMYKFYK